MIRKRFNWTDPVSGKKYKDICTNRKFMRLLTKVIETEEQAESFMQAYSKVCKDAEHNIGYFITLISDPDVRLDVLELWMVDEQIEPRQTLNREYRLSQIFNKV